MPNVSAVCRIFIVAISSNELNVCLIYNLKAEQLKFPLNESEILVHKTTTQLAQQKHKVCKVVVLMSEMCPLT